jgi:uncharacterized iron-regulated protein
MIHKVKKADILLFGEHHNNPIVHWLQFEVTSDLNKQRPLILGAEMFEADNQIPYQKLYLAKIQFKNLFNS